MAEHAARAHVRGDATAAGTRAGFHPAQQARAEGSVSPREIEPTDPGLGLFPVAVRCAHPRRGRARVSAHPPVVRTWVERTSGQWEPASRAVDKSFNTPPTLERRFQRPWSGDVPSGESENPGGLNHGR